MTPRWPLSVTKLDAAFCEELAPNVSLGDRMDLIAHGYEPLGALLDGMDAPGEAWGARVAGEAKGAFGWTAEGSIWSMWAPLSTSQKGALLALAPAFIAAMAQDAYEASGKGLSNLVWQGNTLTRRWLEATGCFDFMPEALQEWDGKLYLPFFVRHDIHEKVSSHV